MGKSTFLNQILGEKVVITTPKPQTTRKQVRGILTGENFQIVFIDTPGLHESDRLLNKMLIKWAISAMKDVDLVLYVVDVTMRNFGRELGILDLLRKVGKPVILLLNKIDLVAKETLLPIIDNLKDAYPFEAIIPLSAKYGEGIDIVIDEILRILPEGPMFYSGQILSDQSDKDMVSELIREKIFILSEEEIPYSTAVDVDEIAEDESGKTLIRATIYVEKPSQKGIIIGKKGRFIKKVRRLVEEELEDILARRVNIDLWVKVAKGWTKDEKFLKRIGLSF